MRVHRAVLLPATLTRGECPCAQTEAAVFSFVLNGVLGVSCGSEKRQIRCCCVGGTTWARQEPCVLLKKPPLRTQGITRLLCELVVFGLESCRTKTLSLHYRDALTVHVGT